MSEQRPWSWRDDEDLPGPRPGQPDGATDGRPGGGARRRDDGGRGLAAARAAGPIAPDRIDPEALPVAPPPLAEDTGGRDEPDEPDGAEPVAGAARWGQTWAASLGVERLLAGGMFACIAWALGQAFRAGGMRPSQALALFLLTTACFGVGLALGGHPGGRNYRRYTDYGVVDWVLLLIPLLLLVRLLPSLLEGPGALAQDVGSWIDDPVKFFDAGLAWGFVLLFFVWDGSLSVAQALGTLAFQPGEAARANAGRRGPAAVDWNSSPYRFADHVGAWRHLMRLFIFGGCLLLIFTGLTYVHPGDLADPARGEVGGVMPVVLLYFLLGLILASQTSLDRLRAGWLRGGVAIQPGLARRWLAYSVALMGLGLLLALLLPTSYSEQAADQLPGIWRWLWFIRFPLTLVFRLMEWVIGGLAALLFAPFTLLFPRGQDTGGAFPAPPPVPTPLPVEPGAPPGPSAATRLLWGFLLYVLPAALVLYAAWNTWRKRRAIWRDARVFVRAVWQALREAFLELTAALWRVFSFGSPRLLSLAPRAIQERLKRRAARRPAGAGDPSRWLRLGSLSPRELIQYFYVSLLQRAEGVGWARGKGQTPYEYGRDLAGHLPERRHEVESLTEAFVRARYSPAPVSDSDARRVRGPWQVLRDSLQTRRRAGQLASWLFGRD